MFDCRSATVYEYLSFRLTPRLNRGMEQYNTAANLNL